MVEEERKYLREADGERLGELCWCGKSVGCCCRRTFMMAAPVEFLMNVFTSCGRETGAFEVVPRCLTRLENSANVLAKVSDFGAVVNGDVGLGGKLDMGMKLSRCR